MDNSQLIYEEIKKITKLLEKLIYMFEKYDIDLLTEDQDVMEG